MRSNNVYTLCYVTRARPATKGGRDDDGGGEESAKRSRGGEGGGRTVSGERDARHVAADAKEGVGDHVVGEPRRKRRLVVGGEGRAQGVRGSGCRSPAPARRA
jgi:hypothetical protein